METKETVIKAKRINWRQDFLGTVIERLSEVNEADLAFAQEEIEKKNVIRVSEIQIGRLNGRERRALALVYKIKNELNAEIARHDTISINVKDWDFSKKLSRDIKFAKKWLEYLVKTRFNLPENFGLDFRKNFQAIGWNIDSNVEIENDDYHPFGHVEE